MAARDHNLPGSAERSCLLSAEAESSWWRCGGVPPQSGTEVSRALVALFSIACAFTLLVGPGTAAASHQEKYQYVPAMAPCDSAGSDTLLGSVPACSEPQPLSDCAADPTDALRIASKARARLLQYSTGRRRVTLIEPAVDAIAKFKAKGILRCDGSPYTGTLTIRFHHRLTVDDYACPGRTCTVPDRFVDYPLPCTRGSCQLKLTSVNSVVSAQGQLPFPQRPWWAQVRSVDVLDPAGRPFLTHGLTARSKASGASIPQTRASLFTANYVDAFSQCVEGTGVYTTSDGFPACDGVPVSSCSQDPGRALVFGVRARPETPGVSRHGKLKLSTASSRHGADVRGRGAIVSLEDCNGNPYQGPVNLALDLRVSCSGPACGATGVTATDTAVSTVIADTSGFTFSLDASLQAAGFPPMADMAPAILDIRGAEVADSAGRPFATLSGMRVVCVPWPAAPLFCFGL